MAQTVPNNPYKLCDDMLEFIDGAIGFALVDLETGLPLTMDVNPGAPFDSMAMEMLAAVGVSYFTVTASADDDAIQEVQLTTDDAYYFMVRLPAAPNKLMLLAMHPETTNLGLGWMATRQALQRIGSLGNDLRDGNDAALGAASAFERTRPAPERTPARRAGTRRSIWD